MLINIGSEERRLARGVGDLQGGHFLLAEGQFECCCRADAMNLLRSWAAQPFDTTNNATATS